MDWLDLLAVQGTLKSLLQQHSSKPSLRFSLLIVHLSYPYVTTGGTIPSSTQAFITKVMSLLLNMLCRFVIAFLPRSKCLLSSWLQSLSTVILEPKKRKSVTTSTLPPSYLPWSDGARCCVLSIFLMLNFKPAFSLSSFTLVKRLSSSYLHCIILY